MQDNYITEELWSKLLPYLQEAENIYIPTTPKTKKFIEAIIWMLRAGAPWRLLPREYGKWNTIYRRFNEWSRKNVWKKLFEFIAKDPDLEWVSIDSTVVRAHPCAAGYRKGGNAAEGLGRSRGGFTTKIHATVDGCGLPIKFIITPGQRNDITQAPALIENLKNATILGDKAYGSNEFRAQIKAQDCTAVIPSAANRKEQIPHDEHIYEHRHVIECFFSKIKQMRRIFSRFDKSVRQYASFLALAGTLVWLR